MRLCIVYIIKEVESFLGAQSINQMCNWAIQKAERKLHVVYVETATINCSSWNVHAIVAAYFLSYGGW